MKNNSDIISELNNLIVEINGFVSESESRSFIDNRRGIDFQYLLSKLINFVNKISGIDTYYYDETFNIIQQSKRNGGYAIINIRQLIGHLKFLKDGLENNWLYKIRDEISGNEMINFLNYSDRFIKEGKKIESSIITTALLEDTIRKIGKKYLIEHKELEQVINGLKSENIISKTESNKWKYYSGLRNSALHANWDEFKLDDIEKLTNDLKVIIHEFLIQSSI
jgi:hypothetical protein